ncbi:MAG: excinuclease ABC subunit UvrA [Verrucomicrobiales bacterium]|nr:excinuclease ABC subunit UvrA [Verrucomicrobiales bacterium]
MSDAANQAVIRLRGVRHNNLKNFDLDLPLHRLIVVTGLSGSGKSSLAFDTLFAEGQRRYIETFSPYARQFFDRMDKPQVDAIEGIPPAIAIEQTNTVRTTRSTVGTMTELCDHLKVLWPGLAQLHCRSCGQPVRREPPERVWERVGTECTGTEVLITFDLPLPQKLAVSEALGLVERQGYRRLLLDGTVRRLEEAGDRLPGEWTSLTVVQDRIRIAPEDRGRFIEACEQAYHFGKGRLKVWPALRETHDPALPAWCAPLAFSRGLHCAACDIDYREPTPALFSFNHPMGACPECRGFGRVIEIDYGLAVPDRSVSLKAGAVKPWQSGTSAECQQDLLKFCRKTGVPIDVPFRELSPEHQAWVIQGDPEYGSDAEHEWPRAWYGVKGYFRWLESKSYKMHVRVLLSRYRAYRPCHACGGRRYQPETLLYRLDVSALSEAPTPGKCGPNADREPWGRNLESGISNLESPAAMARREPRPPNAGGASGQAFGCRMSDVGFPANAGGLTLADFQALPIQDAHALASALRESLRKDRRSPLGVVLEEVVARLGYLVEAGLGYLTLDRPTRSLSGGETERVNLTTCLGTRLVNTLFVLDEPSVGLHPRDTERLVRILQRLRDAGNTVVVVEHEPAVMRAADHLIDLGPGHGETGGAVVFQGTFKKLLKDRRSLTGAYLSGREQISIPQRRPVQPARPHPPGQAEPVGVLRDATAAEVYQTKPASRTRAGRSATRGEPNDLTALMRQGRVVKGSALLRGGSPASPEGPDPADPVEHLTLVDVRRHNLRNLTVSIPLNRFVCVTGVSGSGKSTLVRDVLHPALEARLRLTPPSRTGADGDADGDGEEEFADGTVPDGAELRGGDSLGRVLLVDQSPVGRTPRSNPAVYVGAFDHVRELFARSEEATRLGLGTGAFSFNSTEGRCERCGGAGFEKIEMQFLSDVFIRCPDCDGLRYRPHILEVKIAPPGGGSEWSVADVLQATVEDVITWLDGFGEERPVQRAAGALRRLRDVGLGYLRAGQPINTLSGGECQRLKLAAHLAEAGVDAAPGRRALRPTLFLFDEPTTGLHFEDVRVLVEVFQRLVDAGHSVLVIEHNLELIKCADWLIDLGPEAGAGGGDLVVAGPPETVAACEASHTGKALRTVGVRTG